MYRLICLMVSSILPAAYYCGNICPPGNAHNIHDVIIPPGTVQEGIWHRVFCPEFRAGEVLSGLYWYVGTEKEERTFYRIGYYITEQGETTATGGRRYELSTNSSMVIREVEATDEASYFCEVMPNKNDHRFGRVDLSVIGTRFPHVEIPASTRPNRKNFKRESGRHTLQCKCTPRAPAGISVVYWSTGEGDTAYTEIIGARFADGSVLQIQHGASYGIGSKFSLEINSLIGVHDKQRFWCHAYQSDGTRSSCYTDVTITGHKPSSSKLKSSKSTFYLLSGKPAILPCTIWEPGDPACDVQWFKVNNSDRHLLTYGNESGFDIAGNFSLLIRTVNESTAGRYRCDIDGGRIVGEAIDVLVIGSKFPLDGGDVTACEKVELDTKLTLECPVGFNHRTMHLFWSFGAPGKQQSTTVLASLVLPEGNTTMFDLGDSCYGISHEGSLILTDCSQDNDVRYWCHVFEEGDVLQRSYVEVTVDGPSGYIVVVIVFIGLSLVLIALLFYLYQRKRKKKITEREENGKRIKRKRKKKERVQKDTQ